MGKKIRAGKRVPKRGSGLPNKCCWPNKVTFLASLGFGRMDVTVDKDESNPSGLRNESDVHKWSRQLIARPRPGCQVGRKTKY